MQNYDSCHGTEVLAIPSNQRRSARKPSPGLGAAFLAGAWGPRWNGAVRPEALGPLARPAPPRARPGSPGRSPCWPARSGKSRCAAGARRATASRRAPSPPTRSRRPQPWSTGTRSRSGSRSARRRAVCILICSRNGREKQVSLAHALGRAPRNETSKSLLCRFPLA